MTKLAEVGVAVLGNDAHSFVQSNPKGDNERAFVLKFEYLVSDRIVCPGDFQTGKWKFLLLSQPWGGRGAGSSMNLRLLCSGADVALAERPHVMQDLINGPLQSCRPGVVNRD